MIALVAFVSYQTFENHVIQPVISSRVVHVSPLVLLSVCSSAERSVGSPGVVADRSWVSPRSR